ncbi:acyltransferase family protein [Rhodopirellula halodulae]|uniref:acyltransferase family protein n=1 Tax=Rhodopirellula halodulae TaxID=2894198 RepID=UPI001E54805D|nr:acyltransferase [Rhodopirellula sp. JC737]MCC9656084.1 acyltransferase [Rhodopirellula sp. JC737]
MKFHRLEAARGFAAVYVCVGHWVLANPSLGKVAHAFKLGQEAVMVFFVLSGFVIFWATSKPNMPIEKFRTYFAKRFTRIYSVWALAVVAMFTMASIAAGRLVFETPRRLLGNAFMLQDFVSAKPATICGPLYGNSPLWSLHYEWWFYMLFPLVFLVKDWRVRSHVVGSICVLGGITYALQPNPLSRIFLYFGIWWIGAHAAAVMRNLGQVRVKEIVTPLCYVALASVPMIVLCVAAFRRGDSLFLGIHPVLETRHLIGAIVLVLLAFAWRQSNWFGFGWTISAFSAVAPISFSLYVLHYNSIVHATYLSFLGSPVLELLAYVTITVAFCVFAEIVVYPRVRRWLAGKTVPVKSSS